MQYDFEPSLMDIETRMDYFNIGLLKRRNNIPGF